MSEPLYTVAELRALEQAAQADLPAGELMRRAGAAAAAWVIECLDASPGPVLVICGPGNNGGDGYVCAAELRQRGVAVECVALAAPTAADAHEAFSRWRAAGGATHAEWPPEARPAAIVDAMFGIGMARPLAGPYLAAAQRMAASGAAVLAIDVPSGLDADRGSWVGAVTGVRAHGTVTFIGAKPGLYTGEGCDAAGEVRIERIGVASAPSTGRLLSPDDFPALLRRRRPNTHKGTYGSIAVVGGNVGMVGAPLLAARAALRLGTGRVYVDCIGTPEMRLDPQQPELMFRPLASLPELTAVVIGCGLGAGALAREALAGALARPEPLVIDADALNLLAADEALRRQCAARGAATVLTPHPLEAARLLGVASSAVQADRIGHAIELSRRLSAIVVLKGAGSVIATTDGRYAINPTGSPALASAGTGDVLAGMIAALVGQCDDVLQSVHGAVWLHGAAADDFGADIGLVASDVAPLAAKRLASLRDRAR